VVGELRWTGVGRLESGRGRIEGEVVVGLGGKVVGGREGEVGSLCERDFFQLSGCERFLAKKGRIHVLVVYKNGRPLRVSSS